MSYLQTDRHRKKNLLSKDRWIAIFFGLLLIIIGNIFSESMIAGIVGIKNVFHVGQKQVSTLPDVGADPEYLVSKIQALESENEELKTFLNSQDGVNTKRPKGSIFAVTQRPPLSPYDALTISGGSANGIQVGDLAFAGQDIVAGTVTAVFKNSSIVTLYSSSGQQQEVYVGTSSNSVISEGRGGGNFFIKVPSETKISVGDPVIWPSMQNVLIGRVDKVDSTPGDAFVYILFKSLVPISNIRYVEIAPNNF